MFSLVAIKLLLVLMLIVQIGCPVILEMLYRVCLIEFK